MEFYRKNAQKNDYLHDVVIFEQEEKIFLNKFNLEIPLTEYVTWRVK